MTIHHDVTDSVDDDPIDRHSSRLAAWSVHALTASGAAMGLMALLAVLDGAPKAALLWLGAALIVDGLDGTLARRFEVRQVLPSFSGDTLDLIIDYLNYVVVPALFIHRFGLLPESLSLVGAIYIVLTSLYCFCNKNMKSGDNYFIGFPVIWNVVALYLYVIAFPEWLALFVVFFFGVLTFTTVKFVHPFRVRDFKIWNVASTVLWMGSSLVLVLDHPAFNAWAAAVWLSTSTYYVAVCIWRTMRDRAQDA